MSDPFENEKHPRDVKIVELRPDREDTSHESEPPPDKQWPPPKDELKLSFDEITRARLAPDCLVEGYLYADVAQIVAPGGVGKTTLVLQEAICIALGRPVWGMAVCKRGWTLIITKEDERERLAARLREIINAMGLSDQEKVLALTSVAILDLTGEQWRLTYVDSGNIRRTEMARLIADAYRDDPPVQIVFDPLVSFGASENLINDNEQHLIEAGRYLVRELGCCTRFVHHTGQAAARDRLTDAYAGRGGSALADGSRMTAVLQPYDRLKDKHLPEGCTPDPNSALMRLERPKVSYAPPNRPTIWIQRQGFRYEHFVEQHHSQELEDAQAQDKVLEFITECTEKGVRVTKRLIEDNHGKLGFGRNRLREIFAGLESDGRIREVDLPKTEQAGARKTHWIVSPVSDDEAAR